MRVMDLQRRLGLKDDGDFGPVTFHALRQMQKKLGIKDDGIYGPITRKNWGKEQ
jgi:murein L,D-transpeptidase YcbB/YkuD